MVFKCKSGEEIFFKEVHFIPTIRYNIISLWQLSENGNKVVLNGSYLWVYDVNGRLLMKVKRSANQLHKILLETSKSVCFAFKVGRNHLEVAFIFWPRKFNL